MFPATDVVVGATNVDATAGFFAVLGFTEHDRLPDGVRLRAPGTSSAGIRLVEARGAGVRRNGYSLGPAAIDIYTSDVARGASTMAEAGFEVGTIADLSLGPVELTQVRVFGPDEVPVVLVASSHRRSSVLDSEPDRLFSQGHSVVWVVRDRDAEAAWWVAQGATKGMDLDFEVDGVSDLLNLDHRPVPVRMTMLSDEAVSPFRLELLEFAGRDGMVEAETGVGVLGLDMGLSGGGWLESPGGVRYC